MIKLLLLIPCEKILFPEAGYNPTYVSVLESISIRGQAAEELEPNAGLPFRWTAVATWHRIGDAVEPIHYNSRFDLIAPDGQALMGGSVDFIVSNDFTNYRSTVEFPLIPIGQAGIYLLRLFYKRNTSEEWEQAGEFPINIRHEITKKENENESKIENESAIEPQV